MLVIPRIMIFAFWPFLLMKRLFTPQVSPVAPITRVRKMRDSALHDILRSVSHQVVSLTGVGVLALVPFVTAILAGTLTSQDVATFFDKFAGGTLFGCGGTVVVSIVLLAAARQKRDVMVWRMMRGPWLAVAIWAATYGFLVWRPDRVLDWATGPGLGTVLIQFIDGMLIVWIPSLILGFTYYAFKDSLRAIDAHPLMPALLTPWFFVGAFVVELTDQILRRNPHFVADVLVSAITAAVITVYCVWKFRVASIEHGIDLRSGPPPLRRHESTDKFIVTWGHMQDYPEESSLLGEL